MKKYFALVVLVVISCMLAIGQDKPAPKQPPAKAPAATAKPAPAKEMQASPKAEKAVADDCCDETTVKAKDEGCGAGCGGCGDTEKTVKAKPKAKPEQVKAQKPK